MSRSVFYFVLILSVYGIFVLSLLLLLLLLQLVESDAANHDPRWHEVGAHGQPLDVLRSKPSGAVDVVAV